MPNPSTGTIPITQNGTVDVTNYASANVNIPSGWTSDGIAQGLEPNGAIVLGNDVTEIASYAFIHKPITSISGNGAITNILDRAFEGCTKLASVDFPNFRERVKPYAFFGCTALTRTGLPYNFVNTDSDSWNGCSSLEYFVHGNIHGLYTRTLRGCSSLKAVDIGGENFVDTRATMCDNCTVLNIFVIRKTGSVVPLQNISAFNGTPFASGKSGGTLYVPASLVSSYQSASNWATILGYTNNQIKSIESTHTDPDAPIDLTLYYADGTQIPSGS